MISIEQAKQLVTLLETGKDEEAQVLFDSLVKSENSSLFNEVGKLTRALHDALINFQANPRALTNKNKDISNAKESLRFVIKTSEAAANRTMDAVEISLPITEKMHARLHEIKPQWQAMSDGNLDPDEFKEIARRIHKLFIAIGSDAAVLQSQLTDILIAQDFQDLSGQVLQRVIDLVHELEERLIDILTIFGVDEGHAHLESNKKAAVDVLQTQDEVDDLLNSLGF